MRRRTFLLGLGLFALPAIACGSPTPTTRPSGNAPSGTSAPAAPTSYGLNQTVSVKNWDVTVQKIEKPGKDLVWSQFGNKSTAAGTWFVVVVSMKNTGNQNFGVNGPDFELRGGGNTYKVSTDLGAYSYSEFKGGQRVGGQVPPGVAVVYYVAFDIAPTATGLQFVFLQDKKPIFSVGDAAP